MSQVPREYCQFGRAPSTKDDREHFVSKGVLEAVVEDDDDGRADTVQTGQLGASSSDKTLRQGLATEFVSGDRGHGARRVRRRTALDGKVTR